MLGFRPNLLADLSDDMPDDFQPLVTIEAGDGSGRKAEGAQEELLLRMNNDHKGSCGWRSSRPVAGHDRFHRRYRQPATEDVERAVAIVPAGAAGAGGTFVNAQRWVHDLSAWNQMPVEDQEKVFGRTTPDSKGLDPQAEFSHLSHVELHEGAAPGRIPRVPKLGELVRRSTPYAFHDGQSGCTSWRQSRPWSVR